MIKVKNGPLKGCIGSLVLDNEMMFVFDKTTQVWFTISVLAYGYEVL